MINVNIHASDSEKNTHTEPKPVLSPIHLCIRFAGPTISSYARRACSQFAYMIYEWHFGSAGNRPWSITGSDALPWSNRSLLFSGLRHNNTRWTIRPYLDIISFALTYLHGRKLPCFGAVRRKKKYKHRSMEECHKKAQISWDKTRKRVLVWIWVTLLAFAVNERSDRHWWYACYGIPCAVRAGWHWLMQSPMEHNKRRRVAHLFSPAGGDIPVPRGFQCSKVNGRIFARMSTSLFQVLGSTCAATTEVNQRQ